MSPGSFVSSESAGSSNSLDDPDDPGTRIITPIEDHMTPATIFEESSAESCIGNVKHPNSEINREMAL